MGTDEQILRSFLDADEELSDTWQVGRVGRGFHRPPLGSADDVLVGATERRLLWYDDELGAIDRDAVTDLDRSAVERGTAPQIVRFGAGVLAVGIAATATIVFFTTVSLPLSLAPVGLGAVVFAGTFLLARFRGESGSDRSFPYLQIDTGDELVTVWGDEDALTAVESALADDGVAENVAEDAV